MNRRQLLAAGAACLASSSAQAERLPIRKAILHSMLPKRLTHLERFQLAKETGFEQVECHQCNDPKEAEEIKLAADTAKLRIHSVMNGDHWNFPLSSDDPEVVERSMKGMRTSMANAHLWGADTVLLVPAVVNPKTSYKDAWERSQRKIRELIPLAEKLKVVIAVEEVWNKFLLSPLEFAHYVDDFKSPWVKAYFDVGNVVLYAFPQDWIRTLGSRIVKLHIKDFKFARNRETGKWEAEFVNIRDGEINWKEVHKALAEIGYKWSATLEIRGGEKDHLLDISKRFDLILEGA